MFEELIEKFDLAVRKLRGMGKLTEKNIADSMREIRRVLLEADVHYRVVKGFIEDLRQRALGHEVMDSLTPGQQVVKIVNEKLTELMGTRHEALNLAGPPPAAVMLVGLQGSGKTTTAGKLAAQLRKAGRRPFLVPADVYRPAAIDQLRTIANQLAVPVFPSTTDQDPVQICLEAKAGAFRQGCDTLILDTAGQKGTGKWTVISALDQGIPLTLIGEAVFGRALSSLKDERVAASAVLQGPKPVAIADKAMSGNDIHDEVGRKVEFQVYILVFVMFVGGRLSTAG